MSTPTTPKTPTPPTLPAGVTKTCHIVKRADFDGYGFNLHSEKVKPGQFIGKIDANSPAEAGGLKEGDRILEVNGVSIGNETHKQVVARIKAIANEVRLLLIDVDGKGDETMAKVKAANAAVAAAATTASASATTKQPATNGNTSPRCEGTKQELPGASANISSISVTSMKRASNASGSTLGAVDTDVVDRAMPAQQNGIADNLGKQPDAKPVAINNNNTLLSMPQPPPPSAMLATVNNNNNNNNNGMIYTTNGTNGNGSILKQPTSMPSPTNNMPASPAGTGAGGGVAVNRAGSLNLPLTAAEMRAKLASKKKYDPKNESVDLKKKFDIIQKL